MPTPKVLICGGGIAGSTLAFWLAKHIFHVTVLERSRNKNSFGQGIDIEGPALEIVKLMGIEDQIRSRTTKELGLRIIDEKGKTWGIFDIDGAGLTSDIEILRGDLAEILYDAASASDKVTYRFDTVPLSMRQSADKVIVEMEERTSQKITTGEFDIVVGADGVWSRTRKLAFGSDDELRCINRLGAYTAFCKIPAEEQDWPRARWCSWPGGRMLSIRPHGVDSKHASAFMGICGDYQDLHEARMNGDRATQKAVLVKHFGGLGWEMPRVAEQLQRAEDFYFEELCQIKLKAWSQGRIGLVGDCAYCPTPWTGQGTALAIIGGYVLAQELSRRPQTPVEAFRLYDTRFRPYVEGKQALLLGGYGPYLLNPQTSLGVWILRFVVLLVSWNNIAKSLPTRAEDKFDLQNSL